MAQSPRNHGQRGTPPGNAADSRVTPDQLNFRAASMPRDQSFRQSRRGPEFPQVTAFTAPSKIEDRLVEFLGRKPAQPLKPFALQLASDGIAPDTLATCLNLLVRASRFDVIEDTFIFSRNARAQSGRDGVVIPWTDGPGAQLAPEILEGLRNRLGEVGAIRTMTALVAAKFPREVIVASAKFLETAFGKIEAELLQCAGHFEHDRYRTVFEFGLMIINNAGAQAPERGSPAWLAQLVTRTLDELLTIVSAKQDRSRPEIDAATGHYRDTMTIMRFDGWGQPRTLGPTFDFLSQRYAMLLQS